MAEHDSNPNHPGNVPGLIDQYRQRHRAWLQQADELVRLREEVRSAAEREALEIVTAARRDVRRIIVEARRELLVLTAQLHAAVDAVDQSAGAPPLPGGDFLLGAVPPAATEAPIAATEDLVKGARREVRAVLDEVRAEIEALAAETQPTFPPPLRTPAGPSPWEAGAPPAFSGPFPEPTFVDSPITESSAAAVATVAPAMQAATAEASAEPWVPASWLHEPGPHAPAEVKPAPVSGRVPEVELSETSAPDAVASELSAEPAPPAEGPVMPAADAAIEPGHVTDLESAVAALSSGHAETISLHADTAADTELAPPAHVFEPVLVEAKHDEDSIWADVPPPAGPGRLGGFEPLRFEPRPAQARDTVRPAEPLGTPASADPAPADTDELRQTAGIFETHAEHSQQLSRVFAASAAESNTARGPARVFVGAFALLGLLALLGTLWYLGSRARTMPEVTAASESEAARPSPPTETAAVPAAETTPAADSSATSLSLTIEARRPSWIRASIDGQDESGRTYQSGEIRQIVGARAVSLRAGDAGAVFVSVNGGPPQALGPNGAPLTRNFSLADIPAGTPAAVTTVADAGQLPAASPVAPAPAPSAVRQTPTVEATAARPSPPATAAAPAVTAARPARGADAPAADAGLSGGRPDLVGAGQHWLDAYQRRDREGMTLAAAENINITDERSVGERFPAAQGGIRRDLDQVELELTGDTALLTARMTERTENTAGGGVAAPYVSRVSQIWVRRNGQWRLADVRIIGEARLSQIVR